MHLCTLSEKANPKGRLWLGIFVFHCAVGKVRALGNKAAVGKKGKQLSSLSSRPSQSRVHEWERTGTETKTKISPMVTVIFHCVGKAPAKKLDNGRTSDVLASTCRLSTKGIHLCT